MKRIGESARTSLAASLAIAGLALGTEPARAVPSNLYALTFSVGDSQATANAVLFDGQFIWVALEDNGDGELAKMTENGVVLSTTRIGIAPIEMAYDGANVWVTNYTSSTVSIVDQQGVLVHTIFLPANAHPEGILFDGKYIWTANNGAGVNTVSKFDANTMTLIANYPVGNAPDGLAFDGTYVWVTNSYSDNVMKLNRATGEIVRTYPTGEYPLSMVFDGKDMWIGNGDIADPDMPPLTTASLTELRISGGVNLGTFGSGNGVRGLAYDGTSIWACNNSDNTVTRVRVSDGAYLGTYPTGKAPRGIAFDGKRMWISNSGENTLTVVSPIFYRIPITPAVPVAPAFGIYIQPTELIPQVLFPVAAANVPPGVANAFEPATSIKPRVSPSVAALGGILDALLDN
jgi:YVTN family beta-propeller protein